jgi:MATE family multidrug resistance protein
MSVTTQIASGQVAGGIRKRATRVPEVLRRFLAPSSRNAELRAQVRIAGPLMLASLVNMGMAITDVVMMGWIGPVALAAGAVASDFYSLVFYLCAGVIGAASAIVSHARGAREHRVVRRTIQQAFWAAAFLAVPGALAIWQAPKLLALIGVQGEIVAGAGDYAQMMALTLVPMLGVAVWRQVLAAFADTRSIFRITLITLGLNAAGNYVFMFGKLGLPALGLAGAGLSSALCALFMFGTLSAYALRSPLLSRYRLLRSRARPDWVNLRELLRVGFPIGISSLGEVGVYLLSTTVIGIFGAEALAAHAVALRMAGVLYAFPVSLSQAATVRVGLAAGAGDVSGQIRAARTALSAALIAGVLVIVAVAPARELIARLFVGTNGDASRIVSYAALLLLVLAAIQVFEYVGTVANGVLRGVRDTRLPMLISVVSFWGVATAVGLFAGFGLEQQAFGIWIGLGSGAVAFSTLMLARLSQRGFRLRPSARVARKAQFIALAGKP